MPRTRISEASSARSEEAAAAALQRAGLDLIEAYRAGQSEPTTALRQGCVDRGVDPTNLARLSDRWSAMDRSHETARLLVLGAQAENPALEPMVVAMDLSRLQSEGEGAPALGVLREADQGLPIPEGFDEAASVALGPVG